MKKKRSKLKTPQEIREMEKRAAEMADQALDGPFARHPAAVALYQLREGIAKHEGEWKASCWGEHDPESVLSAVFLEHPAGEALASACIHALLRGDSDFFRRLADMVDSPILGTAEMDPKRRRDFFVWAAYERLGKREKVSLAEVARAALREDARHRISGERDEGNWTCPVSEGEIDRRILQEIEEHPHAASEAELARVRYPNNIIRKILPLLSDYK